MQQIFAYRAGNTILHRLPPLLKILLLVVLSLLVQKTTATWGVGILASVAATFATFILSGHNISSLAITIPTFLIGVFVTASRLFNALLLGGGGDGVLVNLLAGGLYTARLVLTALIAQFIFETTSPLEILFSLKGRALTFFVPAITTVSLALSFIPEVFDAWEAICLAKKMRCPRGGVPLKQKVRTECACVAALLDVLLEKSHTKTAALIMRLY